MATTRSHEMNYFYGFTVNDSLASPSHFIGKDLFSIMLPSQISPILFGTYLGLIPPPKGPKIYTFGEIWKNLLFMHEWTVCFSHQLGGPFLSPRAALSPDRGKSLVS